MHNSQTKLTTQGLTLTVATSAYLMEPAMHPGLEAQAAARIYRLGAQQHPPITLSRPSHKNSVMFLAILGLEHTAVL